MLSRHENKGETSFHLLVLTQGKWGERIAANITHNAPNHWQVHTWEAPKVLPPVIDYPEDFLPSKLPNAELIVALGGTSGLAQLVPDIAQMCAAKAVIAPIDHNATLPSGLVMQLTQWLDPLGVDVVFPKPFCSLTETTYNLKPIRKSYENNIIRRFAEVFGKPSFNVEVEDGIIIRIEALRDSACGCAQNVAQKLLGTAVDEAVEQIGLLHHYFPCLADLNWDPEYHDSLVHASGYIFQESIKEEIRNHLKPTVYLRPHGRSEEIAIDKQGRI
jgi:hypothetical protein